MARVKAKILCFVDNGLRQPGDEFEYKGAFNKNLEYLDKKPDVEPEPGCAGRCGRHQASGSATQDGDCQRERLTL